MRGDGEDDERYPVRFVPHSSLPNWTLVLSALLGAVCWFLAIWIAMVLLGRGHVLREVVVVTAVSFVVSWFFLVGGVLLRRHELADHPGDD